MKDRLSRLLGACEVLTRAETAALAGGDLAALGAAQQVKSGILADLAAEAMRASSASCASCDSRVRTRLARLLEGNRENARLLSRMKAGAGEKLQEIRVAAGHLQTLRSAYASDGATRRQALFVHG